MKSYAHLKEHLRRQIKSTCSLTFDELEQLLGFGLPLKALIHHAWWSNEIDPEHPQNKAWLDVGWVVDEMHLVEQRVDFKRAVAPEKPRIKGATWKLTRERDAPVHEPPTATTAGSFEQMARKIFSKRYGNVLEEHKADLLPQIFNCVSADGTIIGNANWCEPGNRQTGSEATTIAGYVWMLEHIPAITRFLAFGRDRSVPVTWLQHYGNLVRTVEFFFVTDDGQVEQLR